VFASFRRDGAGRPAATLLQPSHVREAPSAVAGGDALAGWRDLSTAGDKRIVPPPVQVSAALVLSDEGH
jgi:hypothetical protein